MGEEGWGFLGSLLEMGLQGVLGQVWPPRLCYLRTSSQLHQVEPSWVCVGYGGIRHPFLPPRPL